VKKVMNHELFSLVRAPFSPRYFFRKILVKKWLFFTEKRSKNMVPFRNFENLRKA